VNADSRPTNTSVPRLADEDLQHILSAWPAGHPGGNGVTGRMAREIVERRAAERLAPEPGGWQPIDTAPKDEGSEILLLIRNAISGDHAKTISRCVASFHKAHGWFTVPGNYWIHPDQIIGWQPLPHFSETKNPSHKKSVSVGIYWQPEWTEAEQSICGVTERIDKTLPHNIAVRGSKGINGVPYLIIQNSIGKNYGDGGLWYISKEAFNKYSIFARTFEDVDPEEVKRLQEPDNYTKNARFPCW